MSLFNARTFNPNLGEITIGAFARCGIRRTELTQQHMADAQFESNLLQSDMQGDGIQLYEIVLETQDLIPGQTAYAIDPMVVFMLDVYIRQNATSYGSQWTNSNPYTESWANNSNYSSQWVNSPGYTPYATNAISVAWANQNSVDSNWQNNTSGILPWTGTAPPAPIPPVPPAEPIPLNQSATDRIIVGISRSDYAAIANKGQTGFPTSYWYDRLLQPTMYLWPVPNQYIQNGLQYYVQKRPTDAAFANGAQVQIPYEIYDYYVWALAERLAFIYAPEKVAMLSPRRQQAWQRYMQASTENVPINMDMMLGSYFRIG